MSKEKSQYGVKIGTSLYVAEHGYNGIKDIETTTDRSEAARWGLDVISGAAQLAKDLGGRVVRFKVRRKEVVVGERDGSVEE